MVFPQTVLPVVVELFIDGVWTDITEHTRGLPEFIDINRGRSNEAGQVEASRCGLMLNNRDGRFSPRNPLSPLFGLIGRNTPLRVRVGVDVRFSGEVPAWPQRWDKTGRDVWVPIGAAGILRRLGQGQPPVESPLSIYMPTTPGLVAYWPMEDQAGSTQLAAGVDGLDPIALTGSPELASADMTDVPGSAPLPVFRGNWIATVPPFTVVDEEWNIGFMFRFSDDSITDDRNIFDISLGGTGVAKRIQVSVSDTGVLRMVVTDEDGAVLDDQLSVAIPEIMFGQWVGFRFVRIFEAIGGNAFFIPRVRGMTTGEETLLGAAVWSQIGIPDFPVALSFDLTKGHVASNFRSLGHLYVNSNPINVIIEPFFGPEAFGFPGETASNRIVRIAAENDVPVAIIGAPGTAAMGPQPIDTVLNILRECAVADQGILYEAREVSELRYRTRADLYNQEGVLELDYSAGVFSSIPEPVDDDQLTRNDVTVTRRGGSSFRRRQVFGVLSVQPPPDGVGTYETSVTANLAGDGQLPNDASWRLNLGTVDEPRFPSLALGLHREVFTE